MRASSDRWNAYTADPNSPAAQLYRSQQLANRLLGTIADRNAFLADRARNKRVLDVGCVDHLDGDSQTAPLHRALAHTASSLVGVDYSLPGIAALTTEGYTVHHFDVTNAGLEDSVGNDYEIVIAGEIVEHLLDLGNFFANLRSVVKADGSIYLSTPNPHYLYFASQAVRARYVDNVDHVIYLWPSGIAEIADRTGLQLMAYYGIKTAAPGRSGKVADSLGRLTNLGKRRNIIDCSSVLYELSVKCT